MSRRREKARPPCGDRAISFDFWTRSVRGRVRWKTLSARARADHEAVEGVFGNLPPKVLVGAVGLHRIDRLLEVGVLGGEFGPQLVGRLETGFQHFVGEGTQLRATGNQ